MRSEYIDVMWNGDDGDGIGRLTVRAAANDFAGQSSAWFNRTSVEAFGLLLKVFPLEPSPTLELDSGFGGSEPQIHVALRAYPVGPLGQVAIHVSLATPLWQDDRVDAQHRVTLELLTTYERLNRFGVDLERVTEGNGERAAVKGERLA